MSKDKKTKKLPMPKSLHSLLALALKDLRAALAEGHAANGNEWVELKGDPANPTCVVCLAGGIILKSLTPRGAISSMVRPHEPRFVTLGSLHDQLQRTHPVSVVKRWIGMLSCLDSLRTGDVETAFDEFYGDLDVHFAGKTPKAVSELHDSDLCVTLSAGKNAMRDDTKNFIETMELLQKELKKIGI